MPTLLSRLSPLVLSVFLAACATPVAPPGAAMGGSPQLRLLTSSLEAWTKPGLDMLQFAADEHQCYVTAGAIPPGPDLIVGGLVDLARIFIDDARQSEAYYTCMAGHGYQRVSERAAASPGVRVGHDAVALCSRPGTDVRG